MTYTAWQNRGCQSAYSRAKRAPTLVALATTALALIANPLASQAQAQVKLDWYFFESNEPENKGRTTARLLFANPQMDKIQISGVCDARSSSGVRFSILTIVADIGDKKSGDEASILFSGGGFSQTIAGTIQVPRSSDGLKGIVISVPNSDTFWDGMTTRTAVDYLVPGYRAYALPLTSGHENIKKFIEACRTYERQFGPNSGSTTPPTTSARTDDPPPPTPKSQPASNSDTGSKSTGATAEEAFYATKELDTIEAWDAYLSTYPTGFHAELARTYRQKLVDKQ